MGKPTDTDLEQRTIREVISERVAQERQARGQAKGQRQRSEDRKRSGLERAQAQKGQRVAALVKSQQRVKTYLGDATKALSRALQAVQDAPLPRHSPEGREQMRVARRITEALGLLRSVGRTRGIVAGDLDFDLDGQE